MFTDYFNTSTDWVSDLQQEAKAWQKAGTTYADLTLQIHVGVVQTHCAICDDINYARAWSKSPDTFSDEQVQRAVMTFLVQSAFGPYPDDRLIDFLLEAPRFYYEHELEDYLFTEKGRRLMAVNAFFR